MLYAVKVTEHEKCGRVEDSFVGVFDTPNAAKIALYMVFMAMCKKYEIDKSLTDDTQVDTDCSFYTEGKEFSIDVLNDGDTAYEIFGSITETELNKMCKLV